MMVGLNAAVFVQDAPGEEGEEEDEAGAQAGCS